ncbi:MAG: serine hydrolase [Gemmatimonadota bacterium]|jgi:CubicO group peptidase (beta-lactamase class C family)
MPGARASRPFSSPRTALLHLAVPFLLAALLLAVPRGAHGQAAPLDGLDAYVTSAMKDWQVPGLAIAVVSDDSVIYAKGFGVRVLGEPGAVDENTLFNIASTSKAFTVAALGILVDEGKLSWDDPVARLLPEFQLEDPYVTREVRVRDLLTHRVGVARDDNLWIAAPFDRDEIIRHLRYLPQVTSFRSRYGYNNLMFITAGEVAGRVSGVGWDDFVARRIFSPLGMTRTTTYTDVVDRHENASGSHARIDGRVQVVPRRNYDNIGGAGAIWSSVHDMAQWVRMQLGHGVYRGTRILSDSTVDEMRTPQMLIPMDSVDHRMFPSRHLNAYGLGWDVQDYRGRTLVSHSGWLNNTRTQVSMIPSEGIGVVAIANLNVSSLQAALAYRILDALLGEEPTDWSAEYLELDGRSQARATDRAREVQASRLEGTSPSLPLDGYAGTWVSDLWGEITVTHEGDHLVLRYAPDFVADLEHWHHDIFRAVWRTPGDGHSFVTFTLDQRGRITAMEVEDFGSYTRKE